STSLSRAQNLYNKYLSWVWVCMEHAFTALKGQFQSLHELCLQIRTEQDLQIVVYWVECCLILHNMIICFESTLGVESTAGWAMNE
ncbi:hypothetical protein SCLCIDRAFT_88248, partial [Scleroderma citrinum Foug A]